MTKKQKKKRINKYMLSYAQSVRGMRKNWSEEGYRECMEICAPDKRVKFAKRLNRQPY